GTPRAPPPAKASARAPRTPTRPSPSCCEVSAAMGATVERRWSGRLSRVESDPLGARLRAQPATILGIPLRQAVVVLLLLRLLVVALSADRMGSRPIQDPDVRRFWTIAHTAGRPYIDFPVEYAPVELATIELIGRGDLPEV